MPRRPRSTHQPASMRRRRRHSGETSPGPGRPGPPTPAGGPRLKPPKRTRPDSNSGPSGATARPLPASNGPRLALCAVNTAGSYVRVNSKPARSRRVFRQNVDIETIAGRRVRRNRLQAQGRLLGLPQGGCAGLSPGRLPACRPPGGRHTHDIGDIHVAIFVQVEANLIPASPRRQPQRLATSMMSAIST